MINLHKPDNWKKIPLPYIRAWTTALRSGEFKQGAGLLKSDLRYCCLGVLSHIQGRLAETNPNHWTDGASPGDHRSVGSLLEDNPCVLAGLKPDGAFPVGIWIERRAEFGGGSATFGSLACANDAGVSFADIANAIDALYQDAGEQQ